jgi:hypothetical protein
MEKFFFSEKKSFIASATDNALHKNPFLKILQGSVQMRMFKETGLYSITFM